MASWAGERAARLGPMHIRRAGARDVDLLTRMRLTFLAEHAGVQPGTFVDEVAADTRAFVERGQNAGTLLSWFADDADGRCVGVVSVHLVDMPPRPDDGRTLEGYVINLYVEPEHRRSGVGHALFEACLAGAADRHVRRVFLKATPDGRPLYERAGFAPNDAWMELSVRPGREAARP